MTWADERVDRRVHHGRRRRRQETTRGPASPCPLHLGRSQTERCTCNAPFGSFRDAAGTGLPAPELSLVGGVAARGGPDGRPFRLPMSLGVRCHERYQGGSGGAFMRTSVLSR